MVTSEKSFATGFIFYSTMKTTMRNFSQSSVVCIIITLCTIIVPTFSYVLVPFETASDMQLWTPSTTLTLGVGNDGGK